MCGITFSYSSRYASQIASRTEQALSKMQHRGPDAYAKVTGPNWGIGHRRLSILDLGHSHQPMQSPDSNFVLSFNGEIYNFKTLRDELSPHWQFKTSGDTEVLLAGLIHYGPSFLRKLRGMWALALWNS
ncbi:asparagine synthetase B, partial [Pseudomonadota bacterium]